MKVAIIGCGQLARMLAQEGKLLGIEFSFLAEAGEDFSPVKNLGRVVVNQSYWDAATRFAQLGSPNIVTSEKEAVDTGLLRELSQFCRVAPDADTFDALKNRANEKKLLGSLAIPCAPFVIADSRETVEHAVKQLGFPLIIKASENGYDGKNQWRLNQADDLVQFINHYQDQQVIVEKKINFEAEVSLVAARSEIGEVAFYPLTENVHQNGVLLSSIAPSQRWCIAFESEAQQYLRQIMNALNYVGVITMECFIAGDQLLVNEIAPRVHNSGHWTLTGTSCSQFKNHLLAIMNQKLGETQTQVSNAMLNLLGKQVQQDQIKIPFACLNWYDKENRPGRKVGHINISHLDQNLVSDALQNLQQQIYAPEYSA